MIVSILFSIVSSHKLLFTPILFNFLLYILPKAFLYVEFIIKWSKFAFNFSLVGNLISYTSKYLSKDKFLLKLFTIFKVFSEKSAPN